jgi:hypothetical protein
MNCGGPYGPETALTIGTDRVSESATRGVPGIMPGVSKTDTNGKTLSYARAQMETPELSRLRAAIAREPGNAELHYLLGAELAQRREYPEAVLQMRTALDIDPKLHFARLQLGLLYLTMSQPDDSLAIWAPLEELEALIRDDFSSCIGFLQRGIDLNKQNAPLNHDMTQLLAKVRDGSVIAEPMPPRLSPGFADFPEPSKTRH